MNLKAKYNTFIAEHRVLRGGAWLITKLFVLTLAAVLFVLEIVFRAIGNSSKDDEAYEYEHDDYARTADKMAQGFGHMDEMDRICNSDEYK